jgi:putative OPT family oligopeptide transporter
MSEHDQAKTRLPEMTGRVIIVSIVFSAMLAVLTVYSGALTGVYMGGSVIAAVFGYVILSIGGNKPTILEGNMVQTIASAGSVAPLGLINAYVAAMLLGMPFDFINATLIITLGSLMGVAYVVVFRRALIVEEEVPFPAGIACAETLKACDASGEEAKKRARLLATTAVIAAVVVLLRDQFKVIPFYIELTQYLPEGFVFNIYSVIYSLVNNIQGSLSRCLL